MVVTIGGIPVYDALITDDESGMLKISLVDDPAVMSNFQAFDSQKKLLMYSIEDEDRRLVRGVIMRADFPIYRRDSDMGEYYIMYKADTIRQMAEKYLVENRQNNFNLMHEEDSDVEGVQMVQFFIKDTEGGVSPAGFEEIADGSLFGEFHVTNDDVWDQIKDGTYKGFSLEGVFSLAPEQDEEATAAIVDSLDGKFKRIFKHNKNSKNMSKWEKFKAGLAKLLEEFGNVTTDKGILAWDGDDDLKEGDSVYIEDSEGNRTPAEDGDYKTEDGKTIVVADGKVSEIKDPETQTAPTDEEMGSKATDKGELLWDGEEDLKEGDEVFVLNEDGERVPAEDGEYVTEDDKVIKVTDGKVESITDKEAEVSSDLKAKRQARFAKIKEAFSESYDDKYKKISDALKVAGYSGYVCKAGDDFAVVCVWDDLTYVSHYYQFAISWDADGNAVVGDHFEVKPGYIPVDEPEPAADPAPSEEEFAALKKENESLKKEVAKLKKEPAAQPAHEVVVTSFSEVKTGDRKLDRLSKMTALAAQAKESRK